MICPKCAMQVPEGKKFCGGCGTRLNNAGVETLPRGNGVQCCESCGAALADGRKFCGVCGKPQTTSNSGSGVAVESQTSSATAAAARAASRPTVAPRPATTPRPPLRPRKPVNRRKLMLTAGLPLLLAIGGACAWLFLPRVSLPPQRGRNVLDVSSTAKFVSFDGAGSWQGSGRVAAGGTVWEVPGGKVIAQGLNSAGTLSPDGEHIVTGWSIFDLKTKQSVPLENPALQPSQGPGTNFYFFRFSNHGHLIASIRNGWLYLMDAGTGKVLHLLNNQMPAQGCAFVSAGFSPDDKMLAAGDSAGNITLWNVKEGELQGTLSSESSVSCNAGSATAGPPIRMVSYSPDGRRLASDEGYGLVRIWDVASRKVTRTIPLQLYHGGVKFTPDGKFLVISTSMPSTGSAPGTIQQRSTALLFVDTADGTLARTLVLPGFLSMGFSKSGDMLLASILNDRLKVDEWTLDHEIRLPFTSPPARPLIPSDATLTTAYEDHAMGHLQQLQMELSRYKNNGEHAGFPDSFQELAKSARTEEGPIREEIHGYRYRYTPAPADAQGNIPGYTISASPLAYKQTGNNSYLVNQGGELHATTDHREAAMTDPVVRTLPDAIQPPANTTAAVSPAEQQPNAVQSAAAAPQQTQQTAAAVQWVNQADSQFQQGDYRGALQSVQTALRMDPNNARAVQLKAKVEETMRILGKN